MMWAEIVLSNFGAQFSCSFRVPSKFRMEGQSRLPAAQMGQRIVLFLLTPDYDLSSIAVVYSKMFLY